MCRSVAETFSVASLLTRRHRMERRLIDELGLTLFKVK